MTFFKYHGTGNDFILLDDRAQLFPLHDQALIERLCHRRFGVGADGLILLRSASDTERGPTERGPTERGPTERGPTDFGMIYLNADGREGSMCGNGGRCCVRFAHDLGLFQARTRFRAIDGLHEATITDETVSLSMGDVADIQSVEGLFFLNTGSPHIVKFVADVQAVDVIAEGRALRHGPRFGPGGTNVNFVQPLDDQTLSVRTYERGVEAETYSCGTGVTAAVLVAHRQLGMVGPRSAGPMSVQTPGGSLQVDFTARPDGSFTDIQLIGPAVRVFTGEVAV